MNVDRDARDPAVTWQVLEERELLRRDPWLRVSTQRVRLPDGRIVEDYHRLRLQDVAIVLAVDEDGRLLVFQGYRHGFGQVGLSMPGGAIDVGETPLIAAQRELREETGLAAARWDILHRTVTNANYHCSTEHYLVARDLTRVTESVSGDLEAVTPMWLTPDQVRSAVEDLQAPVILGVLCGFLLYLRFLKEPR